MSDDDYKYTTALLRGFVFLVLVVVFQVAVARGVELQREAKRRWQHALTGQAMVLISYYLPLSIALPAVLIGAAGIWYCRHYQSDFYMEAFGPLLRPSERDGKKLPGAFYFLLGTALSVAFFPIEIARYAILCLSWADPLAAWVGQTFSILRIHSSASVGGCLGCFATACLIGYISLDEIQQEESIFWRSVLWGALACTVAEAFPLGNDNLLIPIITGAAVQMVR
jgi:dolichol kinase